MKIQVGQKIDDFEFEFYQNLDIKKARFSDYKGQWLVLVILSGGFYVCLSNGIGRGSRLRRVHKSRRGNLSVSTDTVYVHKAWHGQSPAINKIKYPMVADPAAKLCRYSYKHGIR